MKLPSLLTSALAVGLAMPATAQQASNVHRRVNTAPFGAYASGPGSLMAACRAPCGVMNVGIVPPEPRKCVFKCIAAKRAAQH